MITFNRRLILAASLCAGIFFLLGALGATQLPKVKSWLLVKIDKVSRDHLPVRVLPTAIELNIFPLGTTLYGVRVEPNQEIKNYLGPIAIDELQISVSLWQLMQGKLRLNDIAIDGAKLTAHLPKSEKQSGKPLEGLFDLLAQIPINHLSLANMSLAVNLEEPRFSFATDSLNLVVDKRRTAVKISVEPMVIHIVDVGSSANVRLEIEGDIEASRKTLLVESLRIRRGDSYFAASGSARGDIEALDFKDGEGQIRSELQLESMRNWATKTFPKLKQLPPLKGRAFLEAKAIRKNGKSPEIDFNARADGFRYEKMFFGQVAAAGRFDGKVIRLPSLKIENSSGSAEFTDATVLVDEQTSIQGRFRIPTVQVHELLKNLGVGEIPVFMQLSGDLPCKGELKPTFLITCTGHARGENLLVRPEMNVKNTIAAIRIFDANGQFTVDSDKVSYTAEITMPESKGRSSGVIEYKHGFKIDFEADRLAIKDIANISDLKLEGTAALKGTTQGNSDAASVALTMDGTDLWLADYWMGNAKADVSYKQGILSFTGLQGFYTVTRYSGDVKLDVEKKEIMMQGRAPFFDAKDMLKVFSRRVQLPFSFTGTGQAQAKVWGPLDFPHLSYDLKSSLFRGSVAGESFDQAHFDVKSVGGDVTAERVQVQKGSAVISLTGQAHPNAQVKSVVRGRGIKVEDLAAVSNSGVALSGLIDFDMDVTGYILGPDTSMKGTLTKTSIGDQGVPDSNFALKFMSKTVEGSGSLMGDVVKTDFIWPLEPTAPFRMNLKTQSWNFAPILASFAGPAARKDYEGEFTSSIALSSASGGFWNANGTAKIDSFSLSRGSLALKSKEQLNLSMREGQVYVQNFSLTGENIFVKISDKPNPTAKLDLQVNGKLDLGLMGLLTPFFEDLRGVLSFAFGIRGGNRPAELLGSAYIEKGYLKFFEFPHAFEEIQADMLFNQKKVVFNSIKSELGGGKLAAGGSMEIKGYKNLPLNIVGTFDKVTLNVPDKIQTTGSGALTFSGNWFPFLLKGNYDIKEGLMTKKLGGENNDANSGIRRDNYLPEFLLRENFVPLLVDLEIDFSRGLAVKSEVADGKIEGTVRGRLGVKGIPSRASILGSITADREMKVNLRDTEFEVTNANIQFTDPNVMDPKLYVAATARVQSYDINLLVQGQVSKYDLNFTSVPPLPEKDIISLLALGATDTVLDNKISSDQQASGLGQQTASGMIKKNPLSDVIKDKFGFDVQFSAGYADDGSAAVQKIIVSKQVTPNVGFSGMHSLGKTQESEAKVRYRLNEKISVVGSVLRRDYTEASGAANEAEAAPTKLGLDVEYKFEFK